MRYLIALLTLALIGSLIKCATSMPLLPPSLSHPLGTDPIGKDALCEMLKGLSTSLEAAFAAYLTSVSLSLLFAYLSTSKNGKSVVNFLTSLLSGLPRLSLLIFIALITKLEPWQIGVIVGLFSTLSFSRSLVSTVSQLTSEGFYQASLASGATRRWAFSKHVVPHVLDSILNYASISASISVYSEAGLFMLGLEAQVPSLGRLVNLVLNTPGAILTTAGLIQTLASCLTVVTIAYIIEKELRGILPS